MTRKRARRLPFRHAESRGMAVAFVSAASQRRRALVAQWIEQRTSNPKVAGSNPAGRTCLSRRFPAFVGGPTVETVPAAPNTRREAAKRAHPLPVRSGDWPHAQTRATLDDRPPALQGTDLRKVREAQRYLIVRVAAKSR